MNYILLEQALEFIDNKIDSFKESKKDLKLNYRVLNLLYEWREELECLAEKEKGN